MDTWMVELNQLLNFKKNKALILCMAPAQMRVLKSKTHHFVFD